MPHTGLTTTTAVEADAHEGRQHVQKVRCALLQTEG